MPQRLRFVRGSKARLDWLILRRQRYGTHVCWLKDRLAHEVTAHLLDEDGGIRQGCESHYRKLFRWFSP